MNMGQNWILIFSGRYNLNMTNAAKKLRQDNEEDIPTGIGKLRYQNSLPEPPPHTRHTAIEVQCIAKLHEE